MGKAHWVAAAAALLTLFVTNFAAQAALASDRVDVVVVYETMPDESERARTAALGARIACEVDNLRVLSVPENMLDAIGSGHGVRSVSRDASTDICEPPATD